MASTFLRARLRPSRPLGHPKLLLHLHLDGRVSATHRNAAIREFTLSEGNRVSTAFDIRPGRAYVVMRLPPPGLFSSRSLLLNVGVHQCFDCRRHLLVNLSKVGELRHQGTDTTQRAHDAVAEWLITRPAHCHPEPLHQLEQSPQSRRANGTFARSGDLRFSGEPLRGPRKRLRVIFAKEGLRHIRQQAPCLINGSALNSLQEWALVPGIKGSRQSRRVKIVAQLAATRSSLERGAAKSKP